jgi:MFS family permease
VTSTDAQAGDRPDDDPTGASPGSGTSDRASTSDRAGAGTSDRAGASYRGGTSGQTGAGRRRGELLPFQIVIGVTSAGVGGIVAVLGALRTELGFSEIGVGMIVSAGFLAGFVAQVSLASYADRGHARRMVVAGVLAAVVALAVMIVANDVTTWIVARSVFGFAGGLILPGVRRAAAVLDPARVGENMGRLVVGEILVEVGGIRLPFVVFAAVLVLFLPFVVRLPRDRGQLDTSGRRLALDLLRIPRLQGALVLIAAYFGFIGAFEAVIPVMYGDRGASALTTGLVFSTFAVPIVILSPWAGRVADRVGPSRVATLGITAVTAAASVYGVLPGYIWPAILMGVAGVGDAFGFTAVQVTVARAVPEDRQAGALGLMGATEVLAAGATAVPAALLYEAVGAAWMWALSSAATLVLIAAASLLFRRADRADRAADQGDGGRLPPTASVRSGADERRTR